VEDLLSKRGRLTHFVVHTIIDAVEECGDREEVSGLHNLKALQEFLT
jgi:hypothetical protein